MPFQLLAQANGSKSLGFCHSDGERTTVPYTESGLGHAWGICAWKSSLWGCRGAGGGALIFGQGFQSQRRI